MAEEEKDFMAFVKVAADDKDLRDKFAEKIDDLLESKLAEEKAAKDLQAHFSSYTYTGVTDDDCKKILRMVKGSGQSAKQLAPLY
jgi:hypothetical protein